LRRHHLVDGADDVVVGAQRRAEVLGGAGLGGLKPGTDFMKPFRPKFTDKT
jgi:hypothetical protein